MARSAGKGRRRTRGFVMVTMVVAMAALLACVGLAIDTGYLQLVKSRMQAAADAAALGGAQERKQNGGSHVSDAARTDAALNGFTQGVNTVAITVNNPPASGYYTADSTAVEVMISQEVHTLFMAVLGFRTTTVRARGVARQGPGTSCLYVLDPSANHTFQASGGANVQVSCGVVVNSSSNSAIQVSGGAHVTATSVSVVGNYQVSGGATVTPTPVVHVSPESDPFGSLPQPTVGACDSPNTFNVSGGAITTLVPGVYCKGISISGGSRVTLSGGTYILLGGGLQVSGGATVTGTGVTFYNTEGAGKPYGAINISGGTNLTLSAPTTGPLAGILFFQDPDVTSGQQNTFSGGASSNLSGALYFPTTDLSYSGGTGGAYTILVAKTISFSGGTTLNADYSSLPGGTPVKGSAVLSE